MILARAYDFFSRLYFLIEVVCHDQDTDPVAAAAYVLVDA